MKKTLKAFSLASVFVLSGSSVVSCGFGPPKPPITGNENKYIEQELLDEIIELSNNEFNQKLIDKYGTIEDPQVDYFSFLRIKDSVIYWANSEYFSLIQKNEKIIKQRENITKDFLKIESYNDEIETNFYDSNGIKMTNKSAIVENINTKNVGTASFLGFNYFISSNKSSKRVLRDIKLPILNFYYDKKSVSQLVDNHNYINKKTFSNIYGSPDLYVFNSFKQSGINNNFGDENDMLEIIGSIGDFYGENYWDLLEEKQDSYLFTNMTKKLSTSVLSTTSKRYNWKNWSGNRPEKNNGYCNVIDPEEKIDTNHYCGQLEIINQKVGLLKEDESIDVVVKVNFIKDKTVILKEGENEYLNIYLGTITNRLDKEIYEYEYIY
ncbi:hypothetical protein [Spiroplasma monobiae]|uniref:Lipoprotein n=1 Tax=Spiroplasma monobiae MQ-1 TaxID=1336748 RepID=A0A2K9LUW6_SPISQ|nr:hypothetical protein [Spiroplasma monobiae]AUM62820.1 hypothetical protein SMONO_v1c05710 [Spiroplasma monobiae MQ-1]